jgi:hypothetical protein
LIRLNFIPAVFNKSRAVNVCSPAAEVAQSIHLLENTQYWRTESGLDCWLMNGICIKQTPDGLVRCVRA